MALARYTFGPEPVPILLPDPRPAAPPRTVRIRNPGATRAYMVTGGPGTAIASLDSAITVFPGDDFNVQVPAGLYLWARSALWQDTTLEVGAAFS